MPKRQSLPPGFDCSIPESWPVWWPGDRPDGSATVLSIQPYVGEYHEAFNYVLRLAAPRTDRGWLEIAVQL